MACLWPFKAKTILSGIYPLAMGNSKVGAPYSGQTSVRWMIAHPRHVTHRIECATSFWQGTVCAKHGQGPEDNRKKILGHRAAKRVNLMTIARQKAYTAMPNNTFMVNSSKRVFGPPRRRIRDDIGAGASR